MRLQINTKGSWRDVLSYDETDDDRVRWHAAHLASIGGGKLRVLKDDGSPAAHWSQADGWQEWNR